MKQARDGIMTTPGQRDVGKKSRCWSPGELGWAGASRAPGRVAKRSHHHRGGVTLQRELGKIDSTSLSSCPLFSCWCLHGPNTAGSQVERMQVMESIE